MDQIRIAVRNKSTESGVDVANALAAFQKQITDDFAPSGWGIVAELVFVKDGDPLPPGAWLLVVLDDADQARALGYHDLTKDGLPLGKVFARTTRLDGGKWSVTFSHEMLEMLADPYINLCSFDEANRRLYAYEVCDAVEADDLGYDIDGVTVSDFVLPRWFEPTHVTPGTRYAYKSKVTAPFQILGGGYIGYYDLDGGGWQQLNARESSDARFMSPSDGAISYASRAAVGSRRERRRTPKAQWMRSTAE